MIKFILNNQEIETDSPKGMTVLDFVRYEKNLKGTKIGCREGDCGACTILVGELVGDAVKYRTMTSCLMPLANANGKHIVTVEGINKSDGELTPVQSSMVDESGTQCGFCTVGFVMSLTNFCIDDSPKTAESAVSAIDGNICRCTGYKSIERAAMSLCDLAKKSEPPAVAGGLSLAIQREVVPKYFQDIGSRLKKMSESDELNRRLPQAVLTRAVSGGTDLYVQRHDELIHADSAHLFYDESLRGISETEDFVEIGASVTVTDLLESPIMQALFPNLFEHLKLVSSTPIRNMATLAGNFVNASPIGDMTAWFLALDAEIELSEPPAVAAGLTRVIALRDFYLGYKKLAKREDELITKIRFRKNFTHFNFEKVCKRTFLDIASVNTAISLRVSSPGVSKGAEAFSALPDGRATDTNLIRDAHVSAGGVAPIPLYLKQTSEFLRGKKIDKATIEAACEIVQTEIAPISDVRGSESYKRLLLQQLFKAHFVELFGIY